MCPVQARLVLGLLTALSAAGASAESYVAKIYGIPAGFDSMVVEGAGNFGMMTGHVVVDGTEAAATLTPQGFRSLHPSGFLSSQIMDSWGATYHAGYGAPAGGGIHALFWIGGGAAADLHPSDPSILETRAMAGDGQIQSGFAVDTAHQVACTWSRTASSFRVLKSPNHHQVAAFGTDATNAPNGMVWHCGSGIKNADLSLCALLWQGSTANPLDLQVVGYDASEALGCSYPQIVGWSSGNQTGNRRNAVLWNINIPFLVNLNPTPFIESQALSVRNGVQVGFAVPASNPSRNQAILWHGHAASWTNLHALLPYPFNLWSSKATDIDAQGNIVGTVESPDHTINRPVVWMRH